MHRSASAWIILLGVVLLISTGFPIVAHSQSTNAISKHGCTIDPRKPDNVDGELIARSTVDCTTDMAGRVVVTELYQRRSDGTFDPVPGSRNTFDAPEQFDEGTLDVDGSLVHCRKVSGTRKFKSVVRISSGTGGFTETTSNAEEYHRDCIDNEPEQIPAELDEVIEDGCTGELICAQTHLVNRDHFYGCDIEARNPYKQSSILYAEGYFDCDQAMYKRFIYVKICDNIKWSGDLCADMSSRMLNRANKNWTGKPRCAATLVTRSGPLEYRGTYSRTGIDPRRQENGNNPSDKHFQSPDTNVGFDCAPD